MVNHFWDAPCAKHHRLCDQVRPLITPLIDTFGIAHFCYFFVTEEGHSACLSSYPKWLEFYLYNDLFLHNPFLRSPQLIPEGVFFTKGIKDPGYLELKRHAKTFGIEDSIVLTFKLKGKLQGFSFGLNSHEKNYSLFVNELPLLKRFCHEFERKAERSLRELEPVDLRAHLGDVFYKLPEKFVLTEKKRAHFLAASKFQIPYLSRREKECLALYLKGETAKSMAVSLELSQRTVESYLENAKNKLNCYRKEELLKKAQELQDYGLLTP